jgi:peptidoglycan/LPS O-acetylase OafA/YrhL
MKHTNVNWSVLAGLRFFLAMVVVCNHSCLVVDLKGVWPLSGFGGFLAVIGFLIVSGFSIAASYERQREGFARRRYYRIYPTYLACFLLSQVPWILYGPSFHTQGRIFEAPMPGQEWLPLLSGVLLGQAFIPALTTLGQAWTLSIECVYYAAAPLLARLGSKVIWSVISASAFAFWQLPMHGFVFYPSMTFAGVGVLLLAWAWLFGWALYHFPPKDEVKLGLFVLANFLVVPYGEPAMTTFTLLIVGWVFTYGVQRSFGKRVHLWLERLGDISYPLYLVHIPVMLIIGGGGRLFPQWLVVAASMGAALIILVLVDYPVRRWRRRLEGAKVGDANRPGGYAVARAVPQVAGGDRRA